jgi:hypothetical protein
MPRAAASSGDKHTTKGGERRWRPAKMSMAEACAVEFLPRKEGVVERVDADAR